MNVLLLIGGPHRLGNLDGDFPASLVEIDGKPLIELILDKIRAIPQVEKLIVCIKSELVRKFHLNEVIQILWPGTEIITIERETQGAVCTALLAIEKIDNEKPLLILGSDEILDQDYSTIIERFEQSQFDAGVVVFQSVHPRYSFVRLDENGLVVEAAEKRPISRNATATFYYYRNGHEFVESAKQTIRKGASVNGVYFLCPVLNELVLQNLMIGTFSIPSKSYHALKSSKQLTDFERSFEEIESR